jgi:hypothetical protein
MLLLQLDASHCIADLQSTSSFFTEKMTSFFVGGGLAQQESSIFDSCAREGFISLIVETLGLLKKRLLCSSHWNKCHPLERINRLIPYKVGWE